MIAKHSTLKVFSVIGIGALGGIAIVIGYRMAENMKDWKRISLAATIGSIMGVGYLNIYDSCKKLKN